MPLNWGDWNSDTAAKSDIEVQGDTVTLAEDYITSFEADLSNFAGDTGSFETTSNQAYDRSKSLGKTADGRHDAVWLSSDQWSAGDSVTLTSHVYTGSDLIRGGPTLVRASDGYGYVAYVDPNNALTIATVTPTFNSPINNNDTLPTTSDGWYKLEFSHDGVDQLTATIYDYSGSDYSVTATDGSYSPTTVGADAYDVGWYADYYHT